MKKGKAAFLTRLPLRSPLLAVVVAVVAAAGVAVVVNSFAASPSGQDMPTGDLTGWKRIFAEDFTKDAATGSWAGTCAQGADKIVYTGATGTQWRAYPDCYLDTYQKLPYRSDQVLSVHDGTLDFYLHQVDGKPAGANPSPVISGSSQYQAYGRYSVRMRTDTKNLSDYYIAWLLWPQTEADWKCAETDFPEGGLSGSSVTAFAHYGCDGSQNAFSKAVDLTQWHTYTQEWTPGVRKFYLDDVLVGTATTQVYDKPERWQLQTETKGMGTTTGHLYVDWAVVWSYSPGTVAGTPTPTVTATPTPTPTPTATPPASVKIMPLGDSITLGWNYYPGTNYPPPGGYRTLLWQKLVQQDGANIDFVGSLNSGPPTLGDKDHEGHSGERIDQIRANIDTYLASAKPDVVLLMIGTNDILQSLNLSAAPSRLQDLVDRICVDRPTAKIVVSSIVPRPGLDSAVNAYNAAIPGVVTASKNKGCDTSFFNMNSYMTSADISTSDNTHPTTPGYDKMAQAWYPTVKALYQSIVAPTPTPTATSPATKPSDINKDGKVNVFDLSVLLSKWGTADATSDINGSGKVDVFDLSVMLSQWTG